MKQKLSADSADRHEPLLVSLVEAAKLLSVSKPTIERMIADGAIPTRRLRRRRMIPREYLEELAKVSE
jgi:excisionase family DNA binding protein